MAELWIEIAVLAILIGLSGFFSGLEVAMLFQRPYEEAFKHAEELFHMEEKKKTLQEQFAKKV